MGVRACTFGSLAPSFFTFRDCYVITGLLEVCTVDVIEVPDITVKVRVDVCITVDTIEVLGVPNHKNYSKPLNFSMCT